MSRHGVPPASSPGSPTGPRRFQRWGLVTLILGAAAVGGVISIGAGFAQEPADSPVVIDPLAGETPSIEPGLDAGESPRRTGTGVTPLVAPVPFKNTQVGWGLALLVGAIHRFDPDTTLKPSTGAVGGFYTENESWGVMAMEMARLHGDAWRLRGMVGHMNIRYDFYGIGEAAGDAALSIPLEQRLDLAYGMALRRIAPGLYAGLTVLWMGTEVEVRKDSTAAVPPAEDLPRTDLVAPGLAAEFDTRDDDYWPTSGSFAKLKANFFAEGLGSARTFQRYMAAWSWYGGMPVERLVLATNLNVAAVGGDAPFYALPSVGSGRYMFRGYTQGRYRDNIMAVAQAEARYHLPGRFGGAVFGGFGVVAPDGGALFDAKALPAGGLGLRYQLVRRFPMHMRLDVAWGRDETLFYFGVSEAF